MKINFMMGLVALGFFTIVGVLGFEFYTSHEAVAAGLQQCVTNVDGKNQVVWAKDC